MNKLVFILLASITITACETYGEYRTIATPLVPVAKEFTSDIQSAAKDEAILTQQARVNSAVALQSSFNGFVQTNASTQIPINFGAGDILFPAEQTSATGDEIAQFYCSIEPVTLERPKLTVKTCLSDDDLDKDFDRPWLLYQFQGFTKYAGGHVYGPLEPLENGVPYSEVSADNFKPAEISIIFKTASFKGYFFNIATDGIINNPYAAETKIPSKEKLPAKVEVESAIIEVLTRQGDTITYRIVKGFDPATPIKLEQAPPPDNSGEVAGAVAATMMNQYFSN